ncbi:MAG: hypothetical protein K6A82_06190 [Prevotella sp.]|nr:hypothetical protein [Prevotella sp.]
MLLAGIILSCHRLQAQQVLVCDAVSRFPIRDVAVTADGRPAGLTTWQGIVSLPDSFQLASFKKKGYAPEKLRRDEILRDTVFLFPAEHYLDEVVVVGKQTVDGAELLKKMPKRDILEEASPHAAGGFDLGLLLDKRLRRDKKHVRKLREIFKRMDGVADDEDPILKAYRETLMEMKNTSPAHSSPTSPTIPPQQDGK